MSNDPEKPKRHLEAVPNLPPEQLELGVEPTYPPTQSDTSPLDDELGGEPEYIWPKATGVLPGAIGRPVLRAVGSPPPYDPWESPNSPESLGMNAEASLHNMRATSYKNMMENVGIFGSIVFVRSDETGRNIQDGLGYRSLEKAFVALRDLYPDPKTPPSKTDIYDFAEAEKKKINNAKGMTVEKANVILMCKGLDIIQTAMEVKGSKSPLEIAYDNIGSIDQSFKHGGAEKPTRAEEILAKMFSEAAIFLSTYGRSPRRAVEELRIALAKAAGYESPYPKTKYIRGKGQKAGAGADSVVKEAERVLYGKTQAPSNDPPPIGA